MKPTFSIDLSSFRSGMKALKGAARDAALKDAAEAGARVIEANAKINVERTFKETTGAAGLGGSIIVEVTASGNTAEANIGPTKIYGRIHELGGIIKPVHAKMLHWVKDGLDIFARVVHMPARPYLRPAVDGHEDEIADAVGDALRGHIQKAAQR